MKIPILLRPRKLSTNCTSDFVSKSKIVIFGGNGYVGQSIVQNLLKSYDSVSHVISISRSGKPTAGPFRDISNNHSSSNHIEWKQGDIMNPSTYINDLQECECAISCVGAFGSNEFMNKINGDANVLAIQESAKAGVKKFIYISTVENNLPSFILRGYFDGKRRAEEALLQAYPTTGVILRPGFMYGTRYVSVNGKSISIPLALAGIPLEQVLTFPGINQMRNIIPGMRAILARPVSVDKVGSVAARIALTHNNIGLSKQILSEDDIANYHIN